MAAERDLEAAKRKPAARRARAALDLSDDHVRAIRAGEFLFDPALAGAAGRLAVRLSNLKWYTEQGPDRGIHGRMAEALYADLEDCLELMSLFQTSVEQLRISHRTKDVEVRKQTQESPLQSLWIQLRQTPVLRAIHGVYRRCTGVVETKLFPPKASLSQSMRGYQRAKAFRSLVEAIVEFTDDFTDFLFIGVVLFPLIGGQYSYLFFISISAYIFVFTLRLLYGFSFLRRLESGKRFSYSLYVLYAALDPTNGFSMLIKGLGDKERFVQSVIGQSGSSAMRDPVATHARNSLFDARNFAVNTLLVLIKDVPQLFVQVVFAVKLTDEGLDAFVLVTIASTTARLLQLISESISVWASTPALRSVRLARHLAFDSNIDLNPSYGPSVDDFVGHFLTTVDEVSATRAFKVIRPALLNVGDLHISNGKIKDRGARQRRHQLQVLSSALERQKDSLTRCASFTTVLESLFSAGPAFESIRTLDFTSCFTITGTTLHNLIERCPNLERIELAFTNTGDNELSCFAKFRCPRLERIGLDSCSNVSDHGVSYVARSARGSLRSISLRNLPLVTDSALETLAKYCPSLEEVYLEREPVFVNALAPRLLEQHPGGSVGLITEKSLMSLVSSTRQTMRSLKVSFACDPSQSFADLPGQLGPWLEELSLANIPKLNDAFATKLARNCRFLRNFRVTTCSLTSVGIEALARKCSDLELVYFDELPLAPEAVELMWRECPRLEYMAFESPLTRVIYYGKELFAQLERFWDVIEADKNNPKLKVVGDLGLGLRPPGNWVAQRQSRRTSSAQITKADPRKNANPRDPTTVGPLTAPSDGASTAVQLRETTPEAAELVDLTRFLLDHAQAALDQAQRGVKVDTEAYVGSVDAVVMLFDSVRRHIYCIRRNSAEGNLTLPEAREWAKDFLRIEQRQLQRNLEQLRTAVRRLGGAARTSRLSMDARKRAKADESCFPFPHLRPFGVQSTRRVNISVDAKNGTYRLMMPDEECRSAFLKQARLDKEGIEQFTGLCGRISPLRAVTLSNGDPGVIKKLGKFLAIPKNSAYFCWAYPVPDIKSARFEQERTYEHAIMRLLRFGGYLYFDKTRQFISATYLTFGSAFSFNGPVKVPREMAVKLSNHNRWNPVSITEIIPELLTAATGAESPQEIAGLDFAFVYPDEFSETSASMMLHNRHGGFAYRPRVKLASQSTSNRTSASAGRGKPRNDRAIFFSLCGISDTFLSDGAIEGLPLSRSAASSVSTVASFGDVADDR